MIKVITKEQNILTTMKILLIKDQKQIFPIYTKGTCSTQIRELILNKSKDATNSRNN